MLIFYTNLLIIACNVEDPKPRYVTEPYCGLCTPAITLYNATYPELARTYDNLYQHYITYQFVVGNAYHCELCSPPNDTCMPFLPLLFFIPLLFKSFFPPSREELKVREYEKIIFLQNCFFIFYIFVLFFKTIYISTKKKKQSNIKWFSFLTNK